MKIRSEKGICDKSEQSFFVLKGQTWVVFYFEYFYMKKRSFQWAVLVEYYLNTFTKTGKIERLFYQIDKKK